MEHRMKILNKYLEPIRMNKKQKEIRLYDSFRKKIKIGDTILLISDESNNNFARVKVNDISLFLNLEDAIKENWLKGFSFAHNNIKEVFREFEEYYNKKDIEKYGIAVFDIEPITQSYKNSSVLIDTNTIIYRESHLAVNFEVAELYRWFDKLNIRKFVHPKTKEEINRYENEKLRNSILSKLHAYEEIIPIKKEDNNFNNVVNKYSKNKNSIIDNSILFQIYLGLVDYLVTNDKNMIVKAEELFLGDRVLTVSNFLKNIEEEYPDLITYDMLSVRLKKFGEIDIENFFFDTLREDYNGFNRWFLKKNNELAYVFKEKNNILGFLYLKIEDEFEDYSKIDPSFSKAKRLKVGTFKIIGSGFRLGERFLKIIFDNAVKNNVDEIYVTMYENKRDEVKALREFMMEWGFIKHGYKIDTGEIVLVKHMKKYYHSKTPKFNFPVTMEFKKHYFLPIDSKYHTDLFPDSILKNENMNLYKDNLAHRYSIEKIYVTNFINYDVKSGDFVLIYRMGNRYPRKYSSAVTGIGIIQEIVRPKTLDEYIKHCSNKSVFSREELELNYKNGKWKNVIKILNYHVFEKKPILDKLYQLNIINPPSGPRTFEKIKEEDFIKITREVEQQ